MTEPDCPYKDECPDKGIPCNNCMNNKKRRKSHYQPADWTPWVPGPNPYYLVKPVVRDGCPICGAKDGRCCIVRHAAHDHPDVKAWLISCPCPQCNPRC